MSGGKLQFESELRPEHVATYVTVACALLSVNMCFVYSWAVVSKGAVIHSELQHSVGQANRLADQAWQQIVRVKSAMRGGGAVDEADGHSNEQSVATALTVLYGNANATRRAKRQYPRPLSQYHSLADYEYIQSQLRQQYAERLWRPRRTGVCSCTAAFNFCPVGKKGRRGVDGEKGQPGTPGSPGPEGLAGELPRAPYSWHQPNAECFKCPDGRAGQPGLQGLPGFQGGKGVKGKEGVRGADGLDGISGFPGLPGDFGEAGKRGAKGRNGRPGTLGGKGVQGDPGITGERGPPGISGSNGKHGDNGLEGPMGLMGNMGLPGLLGAEGQHGLTGAQGGAGGDAGYCRTCLLGSKEQQSALSNEASVEIDALLNGGGGPDEPLQPAVDAGAPGYSAPAGSSAPGAILPPSQQPQQPGNGPYQAAAAYNDQPSAEVYDNEDYDGDVAVLAVRAASTRGHNQTDSVERLTPLGAASEWDIRDYEIHYTDDEIVQNRTESSEEWQSISSFATEESANLTTVDEWREVLVPPVTNAPAPAALLAPTAPPAATTEPPAAAKQAFAFALPPQPDVAVTAQPETNIINHRAVRDYEYFGEFAIEEEEQPTVSSTLAAEASSSLLERVPIAPPILPAAVGANLDRQLYRQPPEPTTPQACRCCRLARNPKHTERFQTTVAPASFAQPHDYEFPYYYGEEADNSPIALPAKKWLVYSGEEEVVAAQQPHPLEYQRRHQRRVRRTDGAAMMLINAARP